MPKIFPALAALLHLQTSWIPVVDGWAAACLVPLAAAILLSGFDDLIVDFFWLLHRIRNHRVAVPTEQALAEKPEKRIAVFIPLWHEDRVIRHMLEHNLAAIKYHNYEFFVGAYPNDDLTREAVREVAARHQRVHLAICPNDGPTSKADCLNWIYQRMLLHEEEHGCRFEILITHDAEDLIHPEALRWTNFYSDRYAMVQVPVLPLPTPFHTFTHGIYCDEFAEYQIRDMPVRTYLGAFLPSNGVGTGFSREAIEKLARTEANRIFEPSALTEDYENGLRLHLLGCSQVFVPVTRLNGSLVATREYFPGSWRSAVRQRTRWVTGIVLQTWARHGWCGGLRQIYWLWRDRKGLIGNPLSVLTNLLFFYGVASWLMCRAMGAVWGLSAATPPYANRLLAATLTLQAIRTVIRMSCVSRIYGFWFALGVPLRAVFANWINAAAAVRALYRYARAQIRHEPLVWLKTEHAYPSRSALFAHKRRLGDVLVGSGCITPADLAAALATQPPGVRLGEHLVQLGRISEHQLYEALGLQQGLPAGRVRPQDVPRKVAWALPAHVVDGWKVLPFKIAGGNLFLAGPDFPTDELINALRPFTRLEIRFQLVTPANFEELKEQLL